MENNSFGKMKSDIKTMLYHYIHKRNGQPFDEEKLKELLALYEITEEQIESLIVLAQTEGRNRSDMQMDVLEKILSNELDIIFRKGTDEEKNILLLQLIGIALCSSVA